MGEYGAICADPPWRFRTWSETRQKRSASRYYPLMNLGDIKALPVEGWAAPDCVLFLWCVDPMLDQALEVVEAWGFKYRTVGFYWAKLNTSGLGYHTGLGYWTRANPELCLLATRGKPRRRARDVQRLIVSPRREHSRKPDMVYRRIERLVGGPYLEVFARGARPGWDVWGDEAGEVEA